MTHAHRNPHATTRSDRMRHIARIWAPVTATVTRGNWRARAGADGADFPFLEGRLEPSITDASHEPGNQDIELEIVTDRSIPGND